MKTSKDHPERRYEVGLFGILRLKKRGAVVSNEIIQNLASEADQIEYQKVEDIAKAVATNEKSKTQASAK